MNPIALPAAPSGPAASPASRPGFGAVLEARSMRLPDLAAAPAGGPRAAAREALASLERARVRLDRLLEGGRAGRSCTVRELLEIQREACGYAQRVELAAKVVEQGAQTVKQAVNTQV